VALAFDGDLTFTVEGPGGTTGGTVKGAGSTVQVHAEDPVAAWDAALGSVSTGPALLSSVADLLADEGVVVEVSGPGGRVATVGAGVDSVAGRLLAGSRRVRLGRPSAVRPLAVAQLRRSAAPARPALLLGGVALLLWLLGRRTRH
jgi:hypothetical protein